MEHELLKLEEIMINAIIYSDVAVLDQLLHADLVFVNQMGMVLTKQEDLASHLSGDLNITAVSVSDQRIQFFGDTAVVTVSKFIQGSYLGEAFESNVMFTRVWKKFDQEWLVIAASSVPHQ
ncbi:hypothetical protein PBAL39_22360 [Pedobacter sp. BAL39]|uniref:nuclear transport factor 2 family protein n=1 Tax=Pedobacter sp. BAL39 TaxID=391596 RepID=UPI00015595BC|nr:nuclear transport factor 2 family protein [Pedobacter sp. BAL39]EDM38863.1 hypothetical protein PBAL39_22360 [Pedobacter sp. BAL39]